MIDKIFTFTICILLTFSCSEDSKIPTGPPSQGINPGDSDWLIPSSEVFDGGPGKDGIPAISDPLFTNIEDAEEYMEADDLIIGVKVGDEIRGYSHPVLDWHEIVNDGIEDDLFALTYCPLTGTGIRWDRVVDGEETTFGVSGLLYNTNLIPYDRATDSNWSQMRNECVNGELKGEIVETQSIIETNWETWKNLFPDSKVISTNTGVLRNYGDYPYGDYKVNHDRLIFPIAPDDDRLPRKERVLGVIVNGDAKVYRFSSFGLGSSNIIEDTFRGQQLIIFGNEEDNIMVMYNRRLADGTVLDFIQLPFDSDVFATDNEGNNWNIWGEAVSGPRQGEKLSTFNSYMGYWLAWGSFYSNTEIYE